MVDGRGWASGVGMPLVVMCGLPCSGKTRYAERIASKLEEEMERDEKVVVVDESMMHVGKNQGYADAAKEKSTRGTLKSKVERELTKKNYVVLDAMNAIKGYRYELWCIARAAATRYCVVYVDVDVPTAREWNARRVDDAFSHDVFEDLAGRFEVPDSKNRWEAPLFRIRHQEADTDEIVQDVVRAMRGKSRLTAPKAKELKPTVATVVKMPQKTNLLNEMDMEAQSVLMEIAEAQSEACGQPVGLLRLKDVSTPLHLTRPVTLSELRTQKRMFLRILSQSNGSIKDATSVRRMFVEYLKTNIH